MKKNLKPEEDYNKITLTALNMIRSQYEKEKRPFEEPEWDIAIEFLGISESESYNL